MSSKIKLSEDEAYWISPDGEIYNIETTHIGMVFDNPGLFGLTRRFIESVYDLYSEEYRTEGKARREIILMIIRGGWIRARRYMRPCRWTVNASSFSASVYSTAAAFASHMIDMGHSEHEEVLIDSPGLQKKYTLGQLRNYADSGNDPAL